MAQRQQLQDLLKELLGSEYVYFQPPANIQMVYPCIVYQRDFRQTAFADNIPFRDKKRYLVTVIDRDPDSAIPDKIANLPSCTFNRFYVADNLNHDVFQLFF